MPASFQFTGAMHAANGKFNDKAVLVPQALNFNQDNDDNIDNHLKYNYGTSLILCAKNVFS